jgi:hypothetical protein
VPDQLTRRTFLQAAGAAGLFALIPHEALAAALTSAPGAGQPGRFLTAHELDTLRAVTDRLIPGPPVDPQPGAVQARCAEAIDALLGAFTFDPPLIHAGGPFSNRDGSATDDFAHFVPLDAQAELGWRIRLEGDQAKPERLFGGPVLGLQPQYRQGLAALDTAARKRGASSFTAASGATKDAILRAEGSQDFVQTVLGHTLDAMFGAPEYHGNPDSIGWKVVGWVGDVQPRGYTAVQVSELDPGPQPKIDVARMREVLPQGRAPAAA